MSNPGHFEKNLVRVQYINRAYVYMYMNTNKCIYTFMYTCIHIYYICIFLKPHLRISKFQEFSDQEFDKASPGAYLVIFCAAQIQLTKQQRRFSVVFRSFHEEQLSQVAWHRTAENQIFQVSKISFKITIF